MLSQFALQEFLAHSARRRPEKTAVVEAGAGTIGYRELDLLSDRLRDRLCHLGVQQGDRVGVVLPKSIDSLASIFGILKSGAAYVPVDAYSPLERAAYILQDCAVRAVIVDETLAPGLQTELAKGETAPVLLEISPGSAGSGLAACLDSAQAKDPARLAHTVSNAPDDLAYILYTSGSTGRPKGVKLSHQAAISFVDWCTTTFDPQDSDRFSSHAPFHFDLSILDIYVPIKHGATLVLIGNDLGKDPQRLAALIADEKITSWYSTPSILSFLVQYGKLTRHDLSNLHTVLFAGEVFPIKHLRALKEQVPHPRYFNLYGPTETNVCTFFEIPEQISSDRNDPYPIGQVCSHLFGRVVDEAGADVQAGQEGELVIRGPGILDGYWNLPERTAQAFLVDHDGNQWYRTGDIVMEDDRRDYTFLGRRDRMVKRRGYRIELGEIEAGLYRHPSVEEVAVIAQPTNGHGVQIKAYLNCKDEKRPSVIELKAFCAEHLPSYMVPDRFSFQPALPKTSTDKIDYQKLLSLE